MDWRRVLRLVILLKCLHCSHQEHDPCLTKENCGSCIREPGCIWCTKPNILPSDDSSSVHRCISKTKYTPNWCSDVVNAESSTTIVENQPLETSGGKTPVQINPQRVKLQLRRGEQHKLHFRYAQAHDYPVDLYYVMDHSASMEKHKSKLSTLGVKLANTMRNLTSNFKLGFGSFVDKTEMPFVSTAPFIFSNPCALQGKTCIPAYSFKNHLSLNEDAELFSKRVKESKVSSNLDSPEGGFDALMQAMVCHSVIGWREKARHLLIFSTDAGFHLAGDGKLAGVVEPNDGLCHMENNMYTHGLILDYPSIGHINDVAIKNNINLIFAVDSSWVRLYTMLKNRIAESAIGSLSEDSSNVVDLVKNVYNSIVSSITISDNSDNTVEIKYYSSCNNIKNENTNECRNIHAGTVVDFTAVIKVPDCPADGNFQKVFQIRPGAVHDTLTVEIEMLCDCPCEKPGHSEFHANAAECTSAGNLTCGICQCNPGKFGLKCECDGQTNSELEDDSNCRMDNSSEICSGVGTCKCGKCECDKRQNSAEEFSGKYCNCNNFSCKRYGGYLCSGPQRGTCECGQCVCHPGWEGSACECPNNNRTCIVPGSDGVVCSGKGDCVCGQCQCSLNAGYRYSGTYCEECPTCSGRCEELRHCVECQVFNSGSYDDVTCKLHCTGFQVNITEKIDINNTETADKICNFPDNSGCNFRFMYRYDNNKELLIYVEKYKNCSTDVDIAAIVSGVIGSILLAGLLLLIIWKILTTIHDRREYAKFENEKKNAKWNNSENPLFKNPTSHFQNPAYKG